MDAEVLRGGNQEGQIRNKLEVFNTCRSRIQSTASQDRILDCLRGMTLQKISLLNSAIISFLCDRPQEVVKYSLKVDLL